MQSLPASVLCVILLSNVAASSDTTQGTRADPAQVSAEIEDLLAHVRTLSGAQFVRDGKPHSAEEAESHLRMKWKRGGKRIRSAEDFIRYAASGSSLSGRPYVIRYADGREVPSRDVLTKRLHEFRALQRHPP